MFVMKKGFSGHNFPAPGTIFVWHNRMAVYLQNAAKGDLMLDHYGNLTTRNIWDDVTHKELPFNQHRAGNTLALIGSDGWLLTNEGAQFILENCPPENNSDIRKLGIVSRVEEKRES